MSTIGSTKEAAAAAKARMEKAVEDFRKELATVRTGRANASILDNVRVDYHGTPMPVNQLGTVTVPDPTMIVIAPWDTSAVAMIDKAIRTSDIGLNPTNDGKVVRIPIPALTEERRKELTKIVHKHAEEGRNGIRQVRRDANDRMKKMLKDHAISEDDERRGLDEVQKLTDQHIGTIDDLQKKKDAELLGK